MNSPALRCVGQLLVLRSTLYPGVTAMVEKLIARLGVQVEALDESLGAFRGRFTRYTTRDGLPSDIVWALYADARDGSLCLESKSPVDIEESLGMYHGNIFQDAPSWPFAMTEKQVGTWGVETDFENVFLCGSSAQRGGAVSGIPGHNAARKILEEIQKTLNAQRPTSNVEVRG